MIMPVSGFMPNVRGSNNATPMAADRPGIQPTTTPMVTPITIINKFIGSKALPNPWAMSANVFASICLFLLYWTVQF